MQILIEIHNQIYENAKNDLLCGAGIITSAIKNGTPLPEHHGDLIDRSELLKKEVWGSFGELGDDAPCVFKADIDEAPTLIPATKEGE